MDKAENPEQLDEELINLDSSSLEELNSFLTNQNLFSQIRPE